MADTVDELQIKINAEATKANDAIDRLVGKLDRLTTSLSRVNGTNLNGLANGVQRLGNAMQVMNTISTADFTRLATNLTRLGNVNVSALNSAASSMSHLTRAFNNLGTVSANAQAVGEMAKNIAKLGNKSVQTAIANLPQLAKAMNNFMATLSKAPSVSKNIIQMTNALANLSSQGSKVGTASNSIISGLTKTSTASKKLSGGFKGISYYIGKFYATCFLAIRAIKWLWRYIEKTADYIEAFNYYTVSFGKIASKWDSEWENYADENARNYGNSFVTTMNETFKKLSGVSFDPQKGLISETGLKNLGLNIQEVTQYAAQLASMMDAVGQSGETTLATTKAFVKLAGDISSLHNIEYSEAANKIRSVLQGQSRAGYGFGWDTTMASLQATADKLNLSKAVNEMSQMEKQQLRILTILQQSRVAWGDQSNTINTLANQIRIFKNNIKEVGMTLGQLFVPILTKVMPVINGVTIALKRLLINIAGFLGVKFDSDAFGQGYSDTEDDIDGITDSYEEAAKAAGEYKNQLLGFDEVNKVSEPTDTTASTGALEDTIDLTDEIIAATEEYENVWNRAYEQMENKAQAIADIIYGAFTGSTLDFENLFVTVGGDIASAINAIAERPEIFQEVGKAVVNLLFNSLLTTANEVLTETEWTEVAESIVTFLYSAFSNADYEELGELATNLVTAFNEMIQGAFTQDENKENLIDVIVSALRGAADSLKSVEWSDVASSLSDAVSSIIVAILEAIVEISTDPKIQMALAVMPVVIFATLLTSIISMIPKLMAKVFDYISKYITGEKSFEGIGEEWASEFGDYEEIFKSLWETLTDSFEQSAEDISNTELGEIMINIPIGIGETAVDWVKNHFVPWITDIGKNIIKYPLAIGVKLAEWAKDWYNDKFVPWINAVISWVKEKNFISIAVKLFKWAKDWYNDKFVPWIDTVISLAKEKAVGITVKIFKTASDWWEETLLPWLKSVSDFAKTKAITIALSIGTKWTELKQSLKNIWNNMASWINTNIIDKINKMFSVEIPSNKVTSFLGIAGEKVSIIKIPEIQTYKTGGFPEDGLFFANHDELVGQFSNGKTAVANNAQITEGIKWAAYEGMLMAMSQSSNNTSVNVVLQGDADGLFKVVQNKANNYTTQTGRPAFMV